MTNVRVQDTLDLSAVEQELCRLPDISATRIVDDGAGRPLEVHVLALPGKRPKQIVRDVQSVALASFGLEIDRRIVSVVQIGGEEVEEKLAPAETRESFRPRIASVTVEVTGVRATVKVTLAHDDEERAGLAEGSVASTLRPRLVAAATLDAVRQLVPASESLDLDSAQIVRAGVHDVAVVALVLVAPPLEQIVTGSAMVHHHQNTADAVVRAVLNGTNRRLSRLR